MILLTSLSGRRRALLEQIGFRVKVGDAVAKRHIYTAGTVEERLADLHGFFADDEVVYYADTTSLDATVETALADGERLARIGRRGADRVCQQHLYRHRMAALLDYLGLGRAPGPAWPMLASSRR